jgi:hypothetical protein
MDGDSSGKDRGIESRYYLFLIYSMYGYIYVYICMIYIYVYMGSVLPVGTGIPPGKIGVLNPGIYVCIRIYMYTYTYVYYVLLEE